MGHLSHCLNVDKKKRDVFGRRRGLASGPSRRVAMRLEDDEAESAAVQLRCTVQLIFRDIDRRRNCARVA